MVDSNNRINMTQGHVLCVVSSDGPLPVAAYEVLARLAEAVSDAAVSLDGILADAADAE